MTNHAYGDSIGGYHRRKLAAIQEAKDKVFNTTHRQLMDAIQAGYDDAAAITTRLLVKLARTQEVV